MQPAREFNLPTSDDLSEAFLAALTRLAVGLNPTARSHLMGFVHLVHDPSRVVAHLHVDSSGDITIVLAQSGRVEGDDRVHLLDA